MKSTRTRLNLEALGDRIVPTVVAPPDGVTPPAGQPVADFGDPALGRVYAADDIPGPYGYGSGSGSGYGVSYGSSSGPGSPSPEPGDSTYGGGSGSSSTSPFANNDGDAWSYGFGGSGSGYGSGTAVSPNNASGSNSGHGTGSGPMGGTSPTAWSAITGLFANTGSGVRNNLQAGTPEYMAYMLGMGSGAADGGTIDLGGVGQGLTNQDTVTAGRPASAGRPGMWDENAPVDTRLDTSNGPGPNALAADSGVTLMGGPLFGYEYPWSANASWDPRGSMIGDALGYTAGTIALTGSGAVIGVAESVIPIPLPPTRNDYFRDSQRFAIGRLGGNVGGMFLGLAMVEAGLAAGAAGGTVEVVSVGVATPVAVPVAIAGVATATAGGYMFMNSGSHFADNVRRFPSSDGGGGGGGGGGTTSQTPTSTVENLNPADVRFSQTTAGGRGRADSLRNSMGEKGWSGDPVDAVRTRDGIASIDNTRVAVARELGLKEIPVRIHAPSEPLPPEMIGRFGNAQTWGEALAYRTANQRPPLPPTGTLEAPRMLAPK